jgi:DNA-binding Xre family transcriptional regulator
MSVEVRNRFKILLAQKEARDGREYSYEDIYDATGISPTTISAYSKNRIGRFDAVTLVKLCDFLECSIGDLLIYPPSLSQQSLMVAA